MRDFILGAKFTFSSPEWDKISDDAKDLIGHLIIVDPVKRWNADQALRHCWFTGIKTEEEHPSVEETVATKEAAPTDSSHSATASPAASPETAAAVVEDVAAAVQETETDKKKEEEEEEEEEEEKVCSSPVTIVFGSDDEDSNVVSQKAGIPVPTLLTESGDLPSTLERPPASLVARTPERPMPVRRLRSKNRPTPPTTQSQQTRDRLLSPHNDSLQEPQTKASRTSTPIITQFFQPENKPGEK